MRGKFGWGLPPGVSNRMIEEQAGAFEEEEMGEEMEKLVDEVEGIITRHGKILSRTSAEQIITLIGKAVLSREYSELDKLLEMVGRGVTLGFIGNDTIIVNKEFLNKLEKDDILIALREEKK